MERNHSGMAITLSCSTSSLLIITRSRRVYSACLLPVPANKWVASTGLTQLTTIILSLACSGSCEGVCGVCLVGGRLSPGTRRRSPHKHDVNGSSLPVLPSFGCRGSRVARPPSRDPHSTSLGLGLVGMAGTLPSPASQCVRRKMTSATRSAAVRYSPSLGKEPKTKRADPNRNSHVKSSKSCQVVPRA